MVCCAPIPQSGSKVQRRQSWWQVLPARRVPVVLMSASRVGAVAVREDAGSVSPPLLPRGRWRTPP